MSPCGKRFQVGEKGLISPVLQGAPSWGVLHCWSCPAWEGQDLLSLCTAAESAAPPLSRPGQHPAAGGGGIQRWVWAGPPSHRQNSLQGKDTPPSLAQQCSL